MDKRVSAYVDGALRGAKREQLERELDTDSQLAEQVRRSRALGRIAREAWTEGPAAPSPEFTLAAIRPALAEIDRERKARPFWLRELDALLGRVGDALRPSPLLAAAAAVAFVAALTVMPRLDIANGALDGRIPGASLGVTVAPPGAGQSHARAAAPVIPSMFVDFTADGLGSVRDLSPGRPAVLFHSGDGSNVLWLIDEGELSYRVGPLSYRVGRGGQWG
ncbi:MAG: hypothetical protein ACHQ6T_08470 [Myxococcota bacterium]